MRIGILGSGLMGSKLGAVFARAGHEVVFSYSRNPKKLERLAVAAGKTARAGTPAEAATGADAVMLAVHWRQVDHLLAESGGLAAKIILTCTLPMNVDDSRLVIGHSSSAAETLAAKIPGGHVVSAFSTVPSEVLEGVFARRKRKEKPDLVYCGDHAAAKRVAVRLIRDAGFNPVDVGPLANARYVEPFSLLVARIAYEGKGGPRLAYRFERFSRAS
jgi:8-hydroxy-5-deazaflavin:NADPH oxidoreductase